MWKLVGVTMLLSRAVFANINDAYYLSEGEEEDKSLEGLDDSRGTTPEITRLEEDENEPNQNQQPENQSLDYSRIKSQPVRSIIRLTSRDRTSKLRQAPAPMATLLYWPERQDQALRMNARQNPLTQDRRNPSFSPWGGKRGLERYKTIAKIRRPVRVPFNSWGGKRNGEKMQSPPIDLKRNKFVNWEGKKSPAFNSWGGKRGSTEIRQSYDEFSKRPKYLEDRFQKKPFEMNDDLSDSGGQFQHTENLLNNETELKRGSLKLVGSGQITTSGSTVHDHFARVPFEPWGGKRRSEREFSHDDPPRSPGLSLLFQKIGQLFP